MNRDPHPYRDILHRVHKPARYTGGEVNQVAKDPASVSARMVLAFPDVYDIGMSHLGTKILYNLLNKHPDIAAERAFCPWVDMDDELRRQGLPLVTLENAEPLSAFDVVGFSLQYELTFTNMLTMLDLGGIPLRAVDRSDTDPIVLAGGPGATQPEPVAPFVDAFLIGDAEEKLPEAVLKIAELRRAGRPRREILRELALLGGFYCPALHPTQLDERTGFLVVEPPEDPELPRKPVRQVVEDLNRFPFPDDAPVAAAEAIFDRMAIEIARGCTEGCRFCQAGMIYRPVRERDPDDIVETITRAVKKGGYDEVGLTTLSTADYSCISPLIKKVMARLRPEKTSLSVASLRAYGLDEDLFDEIDSVRATGLTFAPEAGTQRMRDVVNKNVTDEDLDTTAHRVFSRSWRRMKLYFMIGLPTETEEDVDGIMETGRRMKEIGAQYHNRGAVGVTVSVSSHVPKPHTPFQWCAMDPVDVIEAKQNRLRDLARRYRLEFRGHDPRTTYLECILGRGDRRMADVIEHAWRRGARFDSWDDKLRFELWMEAFEAHPHIPVEITLGTLPVDGRVPWDHLDMGLEERFLATEYRRSMRGKLSPPCGKPVGAQVHHTNLNEHEADERILVCYHCGVECDMTAMREERGTFLKQLGALEPPAVRTNTSADGGEVETVTVEPNGSNGSNGAPGPRRVREPRVPAHKSKNGHKIHDFDQGEPVWYRVRFAKTGPLALTGHLDFVRALPRVLRRAGLSPHYSEGYHPKPHLEFAPPLPLGVASTAELVDLALTEELDPAVLIERLRAHAPDGLEFQTAVRRHTGERKLSRALAAAEYVVRVDPDATDPDRLTAAGPAAFLARDEVVRKVTRKRKPKTVDIRPWVDAVAWIGSDRVPRELDLHRPGARYLWVRTVVDGEGHARPEEIAAEILGGDLAIDAVQVGRVEWLRRGEQGWEPVVPAPETVTL